MRNNDIPVLGCLSINLRHWDRTAYPGRIGYLHLASSLDQQRNLFATRQCTSMSKYRASHRQTRRTLPMTQPRILFHSTESTFQRSDYLLQARHRDTRLCGCLHLTKDELACRHGSAWIAGRLIGNPQYQLCLYIERQILPRPLI